MNLSRTALVVAGVILVGVTGFQLRSAQKPSAVPSSPSIQQKQDRVTAEGRVSAYPGSEVTVGTEVAGLIVRLAVEEKARVRKGDLIAELRSDELRAALAEARARVGEAEADIRLFDAEVDRAEKLWKEDVGSKQAVDRATRDRESAIARRETARATVDRLEASLDKMRIVAPIDGVVVHRFHDRGENVEAGQTLVTIANLEKLRVEAEVDEFDVARLKIGAKVSVTADGYDGVKWSGTIEEIPDAVSARKLKPEDPGRLSDTRVLLAKVALTEPTPLKLGQRVEVAIEF
jgi:HlyD family secretion protein